MHRFVRGLDTDHVPVCNGLTLPYSSGIVEGHVNRIKILKRQMYGRAGFDLLPSEYSSATDTFKIGQGKWARTRFRLSLTPDAGMGPEPHPVTAIGQTEEQGNEREDIDRVQRPVTLPLPAAADFWARTVSATPGAAPTPSESRSTASTRRASAVRRMASS